jgi:subtilisin family serine protease
MLSKFKYYFMAIALLFSLFAYKVNQVEATKFDVARAKGPVKFKFTLDKSVPFISGGTPHSQGHKGQNSYIVIIDTGVQVNHLFFQDRVVLEACFAVRCPNGTNQMIGAGAAKPVHWHGTHVAGIAAGKSLTFTGVAPEANIIAINVFDSSGSAYDADIIKALNWVSSISSNYNIASVNMSLGGSFTFTSTCDNYIPAMTNAIKNLKDKNIATVIASGNSYAFGMSAPACISHSVSVAAVYNNSTTITDFSNVSSQTTFSAPGFAINSAKTGSVYGTASGTSMATPHVAGAFAVHRSAFGVNSVDSVVSDFRRTSRPSKDNYTNISVPRLDLKDLFSQPVTTTTLPSTTTTLPPVTTTLPPVVTTTTLPLPSTSTTSTTLAPPPVLPNIPKPQLLALSGRFVDRVWVRYRDPFTNKAFINHYVLFCNNKDAYIIPKQEMYSLHDYRLNVPARNISYCYLYGVTVYGTKTGNSVTMHLSRY